ncbi:tetratricopeptide repeat protein [Phenylobacterium aquaticum]|uniref:tetratricopeptide repeat protein n=1 Tax=Phenylobacterium aquaticum TaxID=1763816 RepID=UPI001F5DA096|nr:tetratricopeptide repeat-containing glycosyltransferase family protein [Phenylobacterium aquaticum]MCI3134523.1 tetratricopeptide repeat-containing glycosyltransferase family protein [Phenylobacterium aquaticum]
MAPDGFQTASRLAQEGQFAAAEQAARRFARDNPRHPGVFSLLGRLAADGRAEEALAAYDQALALAPDHAPTVSNRAQALRALGRSAEALAAYDRALTLKPDYAVAWCNRAETLCALDRAEEAVESADRAVALDPTLAEAHANRAQALNALGRHADALAAAQQALTLRPAAPRALRHGGDALTGLGRSAEAEQAYCQALSLAPRLAEAWIGRGLARQAQGRHAEALADLDEAVRLDPDSADSRYHRGLLRLMTGDFAGGWDDYEHRWGREGFLRRSAPARLVALRDQLRIRAAPADLAGRKVLVVGEQGIGDQVMFASLLVDLARDAAEITCVCDPRLLRLFRHSFPQIAFVGLDRLGAVETAGFDEILPLGGLAYAYRQGRSAFPGAPYLSPSPEVVARWRARLGPGRPKIGVSWRGGTDLTGAAGRSLSPEALATLISIKGVTWVSLQYGDTAPVEARQAGGDAVTVFPASEIDDFEDLAGLVMSLDLVVSVQTALIHLTGALGQRCLTLIPSAPEWRYGATGATMPWYSSVELCRQTTPGDWNGPFDRVAAAVRAARESV